MENREDLQTGSESPKMNSVFLCTVVFALFLSACDVIGNNASATIADQRATYVVDSERGGLLEITIGMSKRSVLSLTQNKEEFVRTLDGDKYDVIKLEIRPNVYIDCIFVTEKIYEFSTNSESVRDSMGIGPGSKLRELKKAYPRGKAFVGNEDGNYANFVNESKVIYSLNTDKIEASCFDAEKQACELDEDIEVARIVVR
jgi:hypothetical protein